MTAASATSLLSRRLPTLPLQSIDPLGEGDFFRAYRVNRTLVLRVAKHGAAAEALEREGSLLPRIAAALPLPVPLSEHTAPPAGADPGFALHRLVEGESLSRERYDALPETAREACGGAVGRFLCALHRTDLSLARACGVPEIDYRAGFGDLPARAESALAHHLSSGTRAWIEGILRELPEFVAPGGYRPVLLHGDLSPDHVLYDPAGGRVTGIIDFGDLSIGDPAWDFVYLGEDCGRECLARALAAYRAADPQGLLHRMHRLTELDALEWAVSCATGDDGAATREAVAYLEALRSRAESP